jgi:6-phosphogluconolactonase
MARPIIAYVGTYTQTYSHVDGKGEGIYGFSYTEADGSLDPIGLTPGIVDPAFLAASPSQRFLYCVNETYELDGQCGGGVSAFAIDSATGALTFLNRQPSHGALPCFLAIDATASMVIVANHDGPSTVAYRILADGRLGDASSIVPHVGMSHQAGHPGDPHPHCVVVDSTNRFALVPDKGLDQILIYRIDLSAGTLAPHDPPFVRVHVGTAPRHLAFHPTERFAFVTNEVGSTVTSFAFDAETGTLREIHTVPSVPADFTGRNHTADIRVHPNGRFVYMTNRGHDSVASFAVDDVTGRLTSLGHTPIRGWSRNVRFDPSGRVLLVSCQNANVIVAYAVDPDNGTLMPTGAVTETPTPVCVEFLVR